MKDDEIYDLKIGDKFTVEYMVSEIDLDDAGNPIRGMLNSGKSFWVNIFTLESATLVKPAPQFARGDTVRVIPDPLTGTVHVNGYKLKNLCGEIGEIREKQTEEGAMLVDFHNEFRRERISIHCLELIKKASNDRYRVSQQYDAFSIESVDGTVAYFLCSNHPNAEAAAQAECDRLNAEWRKQQDGGDEHGKEEV